MDETIERIGQAVDGAQKPVDAVIRFYLSPEHRDAMAGGCVLAALASDAARGSARLKAGFELGIEHYLELLEPIMDGETVASRRETEARQARRLVRLGNAAVQHHDLDGSADARRTSVIWAVREGRSPVSASATRSASKKKGMWMAGVHPWATLTMSSSLTPAVP